MSLLGRVTTLLLVGSLFYTSSILCQDIQFWSSLSLTSTQDPFVVGITAAFQRANTNVTEKIGVLINHNVTYNVLNNSNDESILDQQIQQIIITQNSSNTVGLVYGADSDFARQTLNILQNYSSSLPFINPNCGSYVFRSLQRNIINIRPGIHDEIFGIINFIVKVSRLQRVSFLYEQDYADSDEAYDNTKTFLNTLGLSPYNVYPLDSNSSTSSTISDIIVRKPEALIVWAGPTIVNSLLAANSESTALNSTLFVFGYDSLSNNLNIAGTAANNNNNIYVPVFLPLMTETRFQLIRDFVSDIELYAPKGHQELYSSNFITLEGYWTGRWITSILSRINSFPVSPHTFLDKVYEVPVFLLGDWVSGPVGSCDDPINDNPSPLFECCNQVSHTMKIIRHGHNTTTFAGDSEVKWPLTCQNNIPNKTPITFGCVYDEADVDTRDYLKGLKIAFYALNHDPTRATLAALQVLEFPLVNGTNFTAMTRAIVEDNSNIAALVGYSEEASLEVLDYVLNATRDIVLIDPTSGAKIFRQNQERIINVRVGIQEQTIAILNYLMGLNDVPSKLIRIGIYYQTDTQGFDFVSSIDEALDGFETFYRSGKTPPILEGTWHNKLILAFSCSSNNSQSDIQKARSEPIDWLITSTRESNSVEIISNITRIINQGPNLNSESVKIMLSGILNTQQIQRELIASAPGNITVYACSYFPAVGQAYYPSVTNITVLSDLLTQASIQGVEGGVSLPTAFGFLTGGLLAKITDPIQSLGYSYINAEDFFNSLYETSIFRVGGIRFEYTKARPNLNISACDQGQRAIMLTEYNPHSIETNFIGVINNQSWTTCGLPFVKNEDPPADRTVQNQTVTIITATITSVFIFLCFLVVLSLFLFMFLYWRNNNRRRQLQEPDYNLIAIKPKFFDKNSIEAMLIAASPNVSLRSKRNNLLHLEKFLLDPENAYIILQALTKSGLARDDVASCIMYIYQANNSSSTLLSYGIKKEIELAVEESTLFREDSALASLWSCYARLEGLRYLFMVLAESVYDIARISARKRRKHLNSDHEGSFYTEMLVPQSYEVDKRKMNVENEKPNGSGIKNRTNESGILMDLNTEHFTNVLHLKLAAQTIFNKIRTTAFPDRLTQVLNDIKTKTDRNFPDLKIGVIANFVFLRFICSAITNPIAFGLYKKPPDAETLRFLVLISKVLQNLAFGVEFEKEESMMSLNDFIKQNREAMNNWLKEVSDKQMEMEEGNEEDFSVEISQLVRANCIKWMYSELWMNRQVLRRELRKKMDGGKYEEVLRQLEEMEVFRTEGSSDSFDTTASAKDLMTEEDSEDGDEDIKL
eukprot:TRINITY_DN2708_c0_g1_i1.p1 TRINITY_DN2708_c0_g1~~TRINITY_DN2708_c0_g1_i1.p1  ORF type:complete len:1327 (-),score=189.37 TRINITY_DN2708_c0_g1_i1:11-3991(-)